jgi:hypothetical protein
LISSNGKCFNSIEANLNNKIKSFKYCKGDIIICNYDLEKSMILFKNKNKILDSFLLDLTQIKEKPLYPCVLLYYPGDEIEFINDYEE